MSKPLFLILSIVASQLLASCAVYMPIQCAAPQLKGAKEAEISGSTYLNGRYEVAGAYSPVRHLLVRAAYSSLPGGAKSLDTANYYRGHQYELALGTYWPLGSQFLVGALGGFGQAHSQARFRNDGGFIFLGRIVTHEFDARYNKTFGEVYGTLQASPTVSLGAAYRVTQVHFTSLTDVGVPLAFRNMTRGEPMFYFRTRLGNGPADTRAVQLQLAVGSSASFGYDDRARPTDDTYSLQKSRGYLTLGVSLFPHLLLRQYRMGQQFDK